MAIIIRINPACKDMLKRADGEVIFTDTSIPQGCFVVYEDGELLGILGPPTPESIAWQDRIAAQELERNPEVDMSRIALLKLPSLDTPMEEWPDYCQLRGYPGKSMNN